MFVIYVFDLLNMHVKWIIDVDHKQAFQSSRIIMRRLHHSLFVLPRSAAIGLTVVLGLFASNAAHSEAATDPGSPPGISISASNSGDTEHDAAIVRLVQAMGIYPFAREMWGDMFGTPGQDNDPALDRFMNEVLPESWVCESLAKMFKPALAGLSRKEIDDAAKFYQSPVGKKVMQVIFRQLSEGKRVDMYAEKWSPAERAAIIRFANSPAGLAGDKLMSADASESLGEKMGAERVKDVLNAAQVKYAGLNDADLQAEADKVRDGSSKAEILAQLAVIKEYNDRLEKRQMEALAGVKPIMAHVNSQLFKDIPAQQNFAQVRDEMQKIDDTFAQAGRAMQDMVTFTTESMSALPAPQGLKKIWQNAIDTKLSAANNAMTNLTSTVHDVMDKMRELVDFLEAHQANISVDKDGKRLFANKDDLAAFQELVTQLDAAREKLRNVVKTKLN
jgi:hypothetical protein